METIIVLISAEYSNARKVCELIENQKFNSYSNLRDLINKKLPVEEDDNNQPQFFSLFDFMDECNDGYVSIENSFISYVSVENN